jgi:hypothetical protein
MVFGIGFGIAGLGEQSDNLEAIRRAAADQDCRRHVVTQIGVEIGGCYCFE